MKKFLFFVCLLLSCNSYSQERRLALVIGNSAYDQGGTLKNPVNDAYAMKQALTRVGFEVQEYYNLDQGEMKRAVDEFGLKLKGYDVGLFFYAGHGVQARGSNYLIPVDANLLSENDVEYDCIDAGRVLGKMEDAENRTNIIILDACRNNPFERSWTRSATGRGLASMDAPVGSILAYATAPGSTASDGTGNNGLYTAALIDYIGVSGLSIENVFKQVRIAVINQSDGTQTPWESTSLTGDFYFAGSSGSAFSGNESFQAAVTSSQTTKVIHSKTQTGLKGTVTDINDNVYRTIRIGDQVWMAENLKVTRYADGSEISLVKEKSMWRKLKRYDKAYCWYNNSTANRDSYGGLYTWAAAMNGVASSDANPSGVQGVCPDGWHLPSDAEWKELEMYLGMSQAATNKRSWRGSNEGGLLKEAGTMHWKSDNKGATNETGFSALPGGYRDSDGTFDDVGSFAYFWTATENGGSYAWYRDLSYGSAGVFRYNYYRNSGFSVRCLQDD